MQISGCNIDKAFLSCFHYELVMDSQRLNPIKKAIKEIIGEEDVVLEIGTGSGILSLLIARRAKKVITIEKDPVLAEYATKAFNQSEYGKKIKLITGDALEVDLPQADVIVCELLDTALISELQVPILNRANKFLNKGGRILPEKAVTYLSLVDSTYRLGDFTMRSPYYVRAYLKKTQPIIMSNKKELVVADFYQQTPLKVDRTLKIHPNKQGVVNSVCLTTNTHWSPGIVAESAPTLNCPLVFPLESDLKVTPEDIVRVNIKYTHGTNLKDVQTSAEII